MAESKRIGVLRGMETTFTDTIVEHINSRYGDRNIRADFVLLDTVSMDGDPEYNVILDRISHDVPFYRSYLKWAALNGTYIVNNPFWWSADDKFIDNVIAERVGVAVPRTVLLPHKDRPPRTEPSSFRNLDYPINWASAFEYVGFPAFLKPHDGGGWRGVSRVDNPNQFFQAFDASGDACMILQEGIAFDSYFRIYCVGQRSVHIMRYNPTAEPARRYFDVPEEPVDADLLARLERDTLALCRALGYDLNTVEFAVHDGVPYAIDFMNPAPDADANSVGPGNFSWIVEKMGEFLVWVADHPTRRQALAPRV